MPNYYRSNEADFQLWLRQRIWVSGSEMDERRYALVNFSDSITRLMKNKGYTMDCRWNHTTSYPLLNWIYRLSLEEIARKNYNKQAFIPQPLHRNTEEDRDYFYHMIDCDTVNAFMDEWAADVEDLDPNTRVGRRIRAELQDFLYNFIDLNSSKQGHVIARFWEDSCSDSDGDYGKGRRDNYLRDANEGFHGGRGYKV